MSSFNTLCVFLLVITSSLAANADTFFEPSIGYRTETLKLTDKASSELKATMASPVYGLKIGYQSPLGIDVNLAGDYSTGKAELNPLTEKNNFSHKTIAAQLGISALGLMKIYLGYGFSNELDIDAGLLNSDIKLKGTAYQAGLQFRLFSSTYFGAQYSINQFKTVEGKSYTSGDSVDQYFSKLDSQDFSFTLSIVF